MVRYVMAIMLIFIGTLLVLVNFDVIVLDIAYAWNILYPLIFIAFGMKLFWDNVKYRQGSWVFGSFLIIFGALLLMGVLDIISFTFSDIVKLWPLLIIYIGFSIVGKPKRKKKKIRYHNQGQKWTFDKKKWHNFSVGDFEFKEPNWKVEPMNLWNAAGNYYIDFSKAFIPEKEIPISINSLAGDVQLLIPGNVPFRINASVKAGEINVLGQTVDGINRSFFFETDDYDMAVRKLDLSIKLKTGTIRVDRV